MREELLVQGIIERLPRNSKVVDVQRAIAGISATGIVNSPNQTDKLVPGIF